MVVGNYVYSILLGMSVPDISGKAIANLEIESLRHVAPTFHGDTLYGETRCWTSGSRRRKDDRGVVHVETIGYNQDGTVVCIFRRKVMVPKDSYLDARGGEQPGRPVPQPGQELAGPRHRLRAAAERGPAVERWEQRREVVLGLLALLFLGAYAWPILDPRLPAPAPLRLRRSPRRWSGWPSSSTTRCAPAPRRPGRAGWRAPRSSWSLLVLPILRPLRLLVLLTLLRQLNRGGTAELRAGWGSTSARAR